MKIIKPHQLQTNAQIAIVVSTFNEHITKNLWEAAISTFKEQGLTEKQITTVWVPGAVEIPLTVKRLAMTGKYSAILTLGAVIQSDTDHHLYVNQAVTQGCLKISLKYNLPVILGVLTVGNEQQAIVRSRHDGNNKGAQCAIALLQSLSVLNQIE